MQRAIKILKGALIGDPVSYSISHLVYPKLFAEYGIEGEFKKIHLPIEKLRGFFLNDPSFDFITVTMPHKEGVIPYLDALTSDAKAMNAVNYIANINGELLGCNFDGIGALDVIEENMSVKGKTVVVVGAGGAARAAVYEAKKRGAHLICVNRTEIKGRALAKSFGIEFANSVPVGFDVLINATSIGMDPKDTRKLVPDTFSFSDAVVLDMASRSGDCLLRKCVEKSCGTYISGERMFLSLTKAGLNFILQQ